MKARHRFMRRTAMVIFGIAVSLCWYIIVNKFDWSNPLVSAVGLVVVDDYFFVGIITVATIALLGWIWMSWND